MSGDNAQSVQEVLFLNAGSPFSQEVFKRIRPAIPRERFPHEPLRATFNCTVDGLALIASFDGLPAKYGSVAEQVVRAAGIDLVVKSPCAMLAGNVVRAKRWRDVFLYAAVPALFAIPLLTVLTKAAMMPSVGLFVLDLVALALAQAHLFHRRLALGTARFVAEIPVPGMRLHIAARS